MGECKQLKIKQKALRGNLTGQGDEVYMPNKANDGETNTLPWYILCHLNPTWIEQVLQKDSDGWFAAADGTKLPPYRFYIPYHHMPLLTTNTYAEAYDAPGYNPVKEENGLRNDLHDFVFIQATAHRVEQIMKSDWNRKTRLHLHYYRDPNGEKVTIPDAEMQLLIRTLQDHHLTFYFDQPVADFSVGDAVKLQIVPWTGKSAVIKAIHVKGGQTDITVSLNIFNRTKSINFKNIHVGDVLFEDTHKGRLLSGNPITNYEEEIIDILSHRYTQKPSEEVMEKDSLRLKRLSTYSHIFVDGAYDAARFVALKLICAYLRQEKHKVEHYLNEVQALLAGRTTPADDRDAYLMMALFIKTRNPNWRDAVKSYRNTHPDCPDILRRYHSIVKNLKTDKPS